MESIFPMKIITLCTASLALVGITACFPPAQAPGGSSAYTVPNKYGYRGSVTDPSGIVAQPSAAPDGAIAQALAPNAASGIASMQSNPTVPPAGSSGNAISSAVLPTVSSNPPRPPDAGIDPQRPSTSNLPPPPPPPVASQTGTTSTPKPPEPPTPPNKPKNDYPYGIPVPGIDGMVYSPYDKEAGYVDVRGMKPGALAEDPYTKKLFRVP